MVAFVLPELRKCSFLSVQGLMATILVFATEVPVP